MVDADGARERNEAPQIDKGEAYALRVLTAGRADPAPEAAHDLFVEEGKQCCAQPLEDDEAQRIRAEIYDADTLGALMQIPIGHRISARRASDDLASAPCLSPTGSDWS